MSTEYVLIKMPKGDKEELIITEHSNLFDLDIGVDGEGYTPLLRDLTEAQLQRIAFELLKVCSYFDTDFRDKVIEFAKWNL